WRLAIGDWRLAVGGWRLAVGDGRRAARSFPNCRVARGRDPSALCDCGREWLMADGHRLAAASPNPTANRQSPIAIPSLLGLAVNDDPRALRAGDQRAVVAEALGFHERDALAALGHLSERREAARSLRQELDRE